ncbi:helix-turn-helix transcriptional regulator [Pigmentiphaga aceris]|uniref:Helix-turn-helix transcriptional regulator n=1 Tax=Pigmentiphaga aceris TaxID=1940612 RepID=A0A5C0AYN7_9BURK|nr:helix-turn-helix domain-containing protein [Pigmentiphaga aceris]QEI07572.1 helix-turn-helix transcriptional regulator [Pigmentiphaga aceris]
MAKRRSLDTDRCPVARSLDVMGERWALLIVRDAFDGMRRFGEFQKSLGVARNILADRLRNLVDANILETKPASDGTSYEEYVLTPKGRGLFPVIVGLRQWGEAHLYGAGDAHSVMLEHASGKPIQSMTLQDAQGQALGPDDVWVKKTTD